MIFLCLQYWGFGWCNFPATFLVYTDSSEVTSPHCLVTIAPESRQPQFVWARPTSRISLTKTSQETVGIQKFQWRSQQNYTLKGHLFISLLIIRSSWYCVILYSAKTAGKVDIGSPVFYSYNSSFSYHTIPGFYSHLVIFFTDGNNLYYLNKFCINEDKWS